MHFTQRPPLARHSISIDQMYHEAKIGLSSCLLSWKSNLGPGYVYLSHYYWLQLPRSWATGAQPTFRSIRLPEVSAHGIISFGA